MCPENCGSPSSKAVLRVASASCSFGLQLFCRLMELSERATRVFVERWVEQLRTTFVPRRARTLSTHSALEELLNLAEGFVRSGGVTRPSVDPEDGGHGVLMLADVALEACDYVAEDELLRARHSTRKQVLFDLVQTMRSKENVTADSVAVLRAIVAPLRKAVIPESFNLVEQLIESTPKEHAALCQLSNSIVSELRARGWSDEALLDAGAAAERSISPDWRLCLLDLRDKVTSPSRDFTCFVAVTLPATRPPFPTDDPTLKLIDALPDVPRTGRAIKSGPFLRVIINAHDPHAAAAIAYRRALSMLGALTVFLPGSNIEVSSDVVAVEETNQLIAFELQERLIEEKRKADQDEQARILRSAWVASGRSVGDSLHDALRLRHRALMARDSDSRLLLLWSSIERMTAGARGYDGALGAARELVSHAVSFGKLRRDIGDLLGCIQHAVAKHPEAEKRLGEVAGMAEQPGRGRIDRAKVLQLLLSDKPVLRTLTGVIYDLSPLLAYRCHELWKSFGSGDTKTLGPHLAEYFERSRERVNRQVCRIYRARNRIAHVGAGAERVRDLAWHAHFYLTQLMAICVHYSGTKPRSTQDILLARMGQYRAFVRLLKSGDANALSPNVLLRPALVVGDDR